MTDIGSVLDAAEAKANAETPEVPEAPAAGNDVETPAEPETPASPTDPPPDAPQPTTPDPEPEPEQPEDTPEEPTPEEDEDAKNFAAACKEHDIDPADPKAGAKLATAWRSAAARTAPETPAAPEPPATPEKTLEQIGQEFTETDPTMVRLRDEFTRLHNEAQALIERNIETGAEAVGTGKIGTIDKELAEIERALNPPKIEGVDLESRRLDEFEERQVKERRTELREQRSELLRRESGLRREARATLTSYWGHLEKRLDAERSKRAESEEAARRELEVAEGAGRIKGRIRTEFEDLYKASGFPAENAKLRDGLLRQVMLSLGSVRKSLPGERFTYDGDAKTDLSINLKREFKGAIDTIDEHHRVRSGNYGTRKRGALPASPSPVPAARPAQQQPTSALPAGAHDVREGLSMILDKAEARARR